MEKEYYLKVKFPSGKNFNALELEKIIHKSLYREFSEFKDGVLSVPIYSFSEFDVICTDIKFYEKEGKGTAL